MSDGAYIVVAMLIISNALMIWRCNILSRRIDMANDRLDRAIMSLQREPAERGKLSRRLAQAETKIARLQKWSRVDVGREKQP